MSQSEDIDAINQAIIETEAVTPDAINLKDKWVEWHDGLGWYERNFNSEIYDLARNKRNAFWKANAVTRADRKAVDAHIKDGLTTEEMEGAPDRRKSTGDYAIQPKPFIPDSIKYGALAVLGISVVAFAYKAPEAIMQRVKSSETKDRLKQFRQRVADRIRG